MNKSQETTTLGGGCFWCLEAVFSELRGVENVVSGYSGGSVPNPSYQQICTGATGHAEVVQITFNPDIISFKELFEIFLTIHDPTTLNRQGADVGTQYRSVIFYRTKEQEKVARDAIKEFEVSKIWSAPIVTELTPFKVFYPAEEYDQEYFKRNPDQMYCSVVISPKLAKFRKRYFTKLKKE
ncbi:MAG: peptide-methionine (S)-S-oxide reductase MsrA [Candidatus Methanoperedens sp.]|nr:peptide-methionine (S)-S-oxide reductase MsrA [Candidatus Methanoperedens sp.]